MSPRLSIVIGTYNQRAILEKVLGSLIQQSAPHSAYEIVVVDSSSSDGTKALLEKYQAPGFLRFFIQENRGKVSARNRGVQEAQGEIILFTDGDLIADEKLVAEHIACHERFERVAAEGLEYNLKDPNRPIEDPENRKPILLQRLRPYQTLDFTCCLTGNLSLRKKDLLEAGLFDTDFVTYGWEDMELGIRLEQKGIRLIYLPTAINYHHQFVNRDDELIRKYQMGQSAVTFYQKHPDPRVHTVLGLQRPLMAVYAWIRRHPHWVAFLERNYRQGPFAWLWYGLLIQIRYRDGVMEAWK